MKKTVSSIGFSVWPLQWNAMCDGVFGLPTLLGVSITCFADDITILTEARTEDEPERLVNKMVADIFDWMSTLGASNLSPKRQRQKRLWSRRKGGLHPFNSW